MMAVNEFDTVFTVEQAKALRAAARVVYGAQRWIEEAYAATLERLSTTGDIHADKMQAPHEAADAEFDAILAEYRNSDAKAAHDRQERAGLAILAMMGEEFLNDYLNGEVDCDSV